MNGVQINQIPIHSNYENAYQTQQNSQLQRFNSQMIRSSPVRQYSPAHSEFSKPHRSSSFSQLNHISLNQDLSTINQHRATQIIISSDKKKPLESFRKNNRQYEDTTSSYLPQIKKFKEPQAVITIHNDQKLFGQMQGLGPVNVGTEEWQEAKLKKQRMNAYIN